MVFVIEGEEDDRECIEEEGEGDGRKGGPTEQRGNVSAVTTPWDFGAEESAPSLHAMAKVTMAKATKLVGDIEGRKIVILVDWRVTHNFISPRMVEEMGLSVTEGKGFFVVIGDGSQWEGVGYCWEVRVKIQGVEFVLTCFPFPIARSDLMLGMAWLERLGDSVLTGED